MISVVIPVKDEAGNLQQLQQELSTVAAEHGLEMEVIFVDDGSRDATWDTIRGLQAADGRVRGIRFRRNFGKAAALTAGFRRARGDIVFTMDGDLQDDPREMPRFLSKLREGFDLVSGWKRRRRDPWHKVLASRVWNEMVSLATGVRLHDHNCGFKCYRREVLNEIDLRGDLYRYVPVLAAARGFRVTEVEVNHRPREHGVSKYGAKRFLRGFVDLMAVVFLTTAGQRPAHVLGGCGLTAVGVGGLALLVWAALALCGAGPAVRVVLGWAGGFLCAVGVNLVGLGLLAELARSLAGASGEPYSVIEVVGDVDTSTFADE